MGVMMRRSVPVVRIVTVGSVCVVVAVICAFTLGGFAAGPASRGRVAPPSPEFVKYMDDVKMGRVEAVTASGHPLGEIPSPLMKQSAEGWEEIFPANAPLPRTYDLRTTGKLTSVKDQGNCGSCWAFASYGSLESKQMPAVSKDYSEYHLILNHGFDAAKCAGGNFWMSTAYMARWTGPMNETDFPYPYRAATVQNHVQDVYFLPSRANALDNTAVKQAIMKYGGAYISYRHDDTYYNPTNACYYYSVDDDNGTNHAVLAVGWNDDYDPGSFWTRPEGAGAFIVRNSWGTDWGQSGFYYMSYYDKKLRMGAIFDNAESADNYGGVYQYDPLGEVTDWGEGETADTWWGANIFKAVPKAKPIVAIATYGVWPKATYELYVYTNVTSGQPRSGTLAATQKGKFTVMGYHTVKLKKPITLTPGKKFSVVMKFKSPGYFYPVPVEYPYAGYSMKAKSKAGESFESADGTTWTDFKSMTSDPPATNTSVCIKVFSQK